MRRRALLALLAALWTAPGHAAGTHAAADAGPGYSLDLDTGGHRAMVKDLAFTPDGALLVSASDDKTIRVWDWKAGETVRVIRGFMGPGNEGKVFAIGVSPDGGTIAAGGYFGAGIGDKPPYGDIRLFDLRSGKITGVLKGDDDVVYDLDFSRDGLMLAAAGQGGYVFLWKRDSVMAPWVLSARLDGNAERIERIAFLDGGRRLAAATADYGIRLWDLASGAEIELPDAEPLRDVPVRALTASADGTRFATGGQDGSVQIWAAADGRLLDTLPRQDFQIGTLAFADQDRRLAAGCGYGCADRNGFVVWTLGTPEPERLYKGHDGVIGASATSPDGTLVASAGGTRNAILVWDPATGERQAELVGAGYPVTAAGITPDGSAIAWGNAHPCPTEVECSAKLAPLAEMLDLPTELRSFEDPKPLTGDPGRFRRAVLASGPWSLKAAEGGQFGLKNAILQVLKDGQVAQAIENGPTEGFLHASYTLMSDGKGLVSGGNDGTILERDRATAAVLGDFYGGHTGEVKAMAEAVRSKLFLTASGDQTLALWNKATRKLVANLFFSDRDWIVWTPEGYYYSSPNGDNLVGWRINQGRDQEARYIKARQLKPFLFSPEIVRRAILLADSAEAIRELRPTDLGLAELLKKKPPDFSVRLADNQDNVRPGYVALEITGAAEAGADVSDFAVLSNQRRVGQFASRAADGGRTIIEVPVEDGRNSILVTGVNSAGYVTERSVTALGTRKAVKAKEPGKLYVLVVGVTDYPNLPTQCSGRSCDLRFPVADAAAFLRTVAEKTRPLFRDMESMVLVNRDALDADPVLARALKTLAGEDAIVEPDRDAIRDEVESFLAKPGKDDTTIIFVAGHGINIDDEYYFIPTDGRMRDAERWQRNSLVDWKSVQDATEDALGARFMFLDTCHAANAFNPRLQKDAEDARIVVFSATAANSTAAELPELGHGVFTYSLIAGLNGAANPAGGGVKFFGLVDYVDREVQRLTSNRQVPSLYAGGVENFLMAGK